MKGVPLVSPLSLATVMHDDIEGLEKLAAPFVERGLPIVIVLDRGTPEMVERISQSIDVGQETQILSPEPTGRTPDQLRNLYVEAARTPWVLALDTDEELSGGELDALLQWLPSVPESIGACRVQINNYFGRGRWLPTFRTSLIRTGKGIQYDDHPFHASVSAAVARAGLEIGSALHTVEHLGPLRGSEHAKRLERLQGLVRTNGCSSEMQVLEALALGELDCAFSLLQRSEGPFMRFIRGSLLAKIGADEAAMDVLRGIAAGRDFSGEALLLMADLHARAGDWEAGAETAKKMLQRHPSSVHIRMIHSFMTRWIEPARTIAQVSQLLEDCEILHDPRIYANGAKYGIFPMQDVFPRDYQSPHAILADASLQLGRHGDHAAYFAAHCRLASGYLVKG